MADFEKVRTGHERWTAQWLADRGRSHTCTLADFGTGQSRAGLGAWPVAFDGDCLKRFWAPESSLMLRLPGRPLAGWKLVVFMVVSFGIWTTVV